MSNLLYLVLAMAGSVVGSVILWLRNRKPTSVESGIEEFHRGLQALAPGGSGPTGSRRRSRRRAR